MSKRVILLVMDSAGIGALPDAHLFGDEGSNTIGNTAKIVGGLKLPNLGRMGLGNLTEIAGVPKEDNTTAAYGKLAERSKGKDTTNGHWEMSGIITEIAFPTYPHGFPQEVIAEFEKQIGTGTLGNYVASGTVIINDLGEQHMATGYPIIYTSADSVFQIAAHEQVIPVKRLYEMCEIARKILTGKHAVARVIARPFEGKPGEFSRTANRHDYSLVPPQDTMLDLIKKSGLEVVGVGKINDIFAGRGTTKVIKTKSNLEGITATASAMKECRQGLIFTNLVDFDMLYGHRNNPQGYGQALEEFDAHLPEIINNLQEEDILIITADHGNDPTTSSSDHSREYIPFLISGQPVINHVSLGIGSTFADIGATIMDYLGLEKLAVGTSVLPIISQKN